MLQEVAKSPPEVAKWCEHPTSYRAVSWQDFSTSNPRVAGSIPARRTNLEQPFREGLRELGYVEDHKPLLRPLFSRQRRLGFRLVGLPGESPEQHQDRQQIHVAVDPHEAACGRLVADGVQA